MPSASSSTSASASSPRAFCLALASSHHGGWGPASTLADDAATASALAKVPFALFNKADRIGKPADFVSSSTGGGGDYHRRNAERFAAQYGSAAAAEGGAASSAAFSYEANVDDKSFSLVDTKPKPKSKFGIARIGGFRPRGRGGYRHHGRGGRSHAEEDKGGAGASKGRQPQPQRKKSRLQWENRRRWHNRDQDRQPVKLDASVKVDADWPIVAEIPLATLANASLPFMEKTTPSVRRYGRARGSSDEDDESRARDAVQRVDTLVEAGVVAPYDKAYDRITTRTAVPLKKTAMETSAAAEVEVCSSEDPVLQKLAEGGAAQVYASDSALEMLMAAPRSVQSWDLLVKKTAQGVWIEHRADVDPCFSHVNETAQEQNSASASAAAGASADSSALSPDAINHPMQQTMEAQRTQRQFAAQVLKKTTTTSSGAGGSIVFEEELPFSSNKALRYRKFTLDENTKVAVRTTVDACAKKKSGDADVLLALFSLNEFDKAAATGADWRQRLDAQRGYIIATEFRNNAFKMSRWVAHVLLAGVDELRVGFVSRSTASDAAQHVVLGCQRFKAHEFATQVGVRRAQLWGSLQAILETISGLPEGTFLLLREPNDALLRFYSLPSAHVFRSDAA